MDRTDPVQGCGPAISRGGHPLKPRVRAWYWTVVFVLLLVPFTAPPALAQGESRGEWVWSRFWSTGFGEVAAVDDSGVYVVGLDAGIWFDRPRVTESVLLKFSLDGAEEWARGLPLVTTDYHLLALNASGVYVAGQSADMFLADRDVILQRFTEDGELLWTRRFGSEFTDYPRDAAADSSGVYVVGDSWDLRTLESTQDESFASKFDRSGHHEWTTRIDSGRNELTGVAVSSAGVFVVGGQEGKPSIWKLDRQGVLQWTVRLESPIENIADVAAGAETFYVVGATTGVLPGQTSSGATDAFLRRYDVEGVERWTRQFGAPGFPGTPANDQPTNVAIQAWGVYVAGTIVQGTPGPTDAFARRFSDDGTELWGLRYVGASTGRGFAVGPSGFYITGNSHARAYIAGFAETPDPPREVEASPGEGQVGVRWSPPLFDGGMPVIAYRIYRGTGQGTIEPLALVDEDTLSYQDNTVSNHVTYHYAVAAINEVGEGTWAVASGVTPGSPPGVVTPAPPPLDPFLVGTIAILGGALLLAVYWLRGIGKPGDDRVPSGALPPFRDRRPGVTQRFFGLRSMV